MKQFPSVSRSIVPKPPAGKGPVRRGESNRKGRGMELRTRGSKAKRVSMLLAVAMVAVLSLGALVACGGSGSGSAAGAGGASSADSTTKTLVKTATNEMTLVDWDVSEADSPITVSSDDAKFADYVTDLREITGFNIESLTMQVKVVEFAGAEIAATHENVKDNTYTIESLEAVVDGKTITYTDGDFKKR